MNEWISVQDRLPDNKTVDSVLITDGKDVYVAVGWSEDHNPLQIDWCYSFCCGCKESGITHWMLLPDMPNKE